MPNEIAELSADLRRAVKRAWLPAHMLTIFSHLPDRIDATATLPREVSALPITLRQLLKLCGAGGKLRLTKMTLSESADHVDVVFNRGGRSCALDRSALTCQLGPTVQRVLRSLFTADELPDLIERFALQSATLSTLQAITNHMLQTTDIDRALYIMLSGLTSGYGVGFNRVALFTFHDDGGGRFRGSKAIGPFDGEEAHRIWEEIEESDKTIEGLIEDYNQQRYDTRFQQHIQSVTLSPEETEGDEIAEAMSSSTPLLLRRRRPRNRSLAALVSGEEYVLAALKPHGQMLGLIYADNLYNRAPVTNLQLRHLSFFIDQTALVWENLELLRENEALARYDGLTGLLNRHTFDRRRAEEQARCSRAGRACALLLIDVDHFKRVNDDHGHPAGDAVLRKLGELLRRETRLGDVAGRVGGDEFAIHCSDLTAPQLLAAARRIGDQAKAMGISICVGGATWPCGERGIEELMGAADAYLYRCKGAGKGCACVDGGDTVPF